MITIPNDVLENGSSTSSGTTGDADLPESRLDAFVSDGQVPKAGSPVTTIPSTSTTTPASGGSRAKLLFGGAASVFAVTPGGVAQFSTPGSKDKPVEVGARSIKSSDPNVDLTLASGNLVANASGPSVELGASDEGTLAVQVTTSTGEVIQQEVTPESPAVQVKADATGGVTVLEATASGEVQKTEIAADGTKTETIVAASELNLNKVEVQLPPALESKAIEALPKLEDRNLNNPTYKTDEAYVAPTTTVPSAAGAKEIASASTTSVPKGETPSTVQTRNAALPNATTTTAAARPGSAPTTTTPRSVSAAGATPTTVAAVQKPTLSNFRISTKTFGDDAFTLDPPDSNSPGGFRYSSSKTDVATVSSTTGRVTIVGAGSTVITATQAAARGFEAGTITATLIVGKAVPTNSELKDITKTFGDEAFTIARPTSNSPGAFTFTSSDEDVIKQSRTTGRWIIGGAGRATITVAQAATDDFTSSTDTLVVTVRKGTPELTAPADVSKAFLDADFDLPRPNSESRGAFTYTSSDSNIVTVTGAKASIKAAGTVTITAAQAGTTDWVAASTTFKVVVAATAPTLSEFADVVKTFGDDQFTLAAPKSNSTGAITFKSSDDKVVTIGEKDGKVSIIGAGTATITATQAATSGFSVGSIGAKVTVAKAAPKISDLLVADKAYGDADFTLKPTSTSGAAFAYSTDKTSIFNVDAKTGLVKIIGVGTAT
ncbi:MAG: Ig-like domain-containing protein, partial [Acidobacteria bacterium]|nr:Ig-like domain-containing protein [Acidobacteriota bacterium]